MNAPEVRGGTHTRMRLLLAVVALSAAFAWSVILPGTARADGGAPNLAYVAGGGTGGEDLVVIDIGNRAVTWRATIGGDPASALLSTDGRFAYVDEASKNVVAIVDARAHTVAASLPVGAAPAGMALDLSRNPNLVYVANSGSNTLTMLNPDARTVVATITVGQHPAGVAVALAGSGIVNSDPNDAEIYVANSGDNTVSVISAEHRTLLATIPVPGGPLNVVVPVAGGIAYVGTKAGTVVAIDLGTHKVLGTLLQRNGPIGAMDYDAVTGQVYAPVASANAVEVLRPASPAGDGGAPSLPTEPLRTLPFAGGPDAVAITFDGAYGFVAERSTGRVTMLDTSAHTTLATIDVGGMPRGIITGSYPPVLDRTTATVVAVIVTILLLGALAAGVVVVIRGSRKQPMKRAGGRA